MAKEEVFLRVEMGKLEIEPTKPNKQIKDENPFTLSQQKKWLMQKPCMPNYKCACSPQKNNKIITICKKKHNRVLREPVLKLSKHFEKHELGIDQQLLHQCGVTIPKFNAENLSLKSLVDTCNQLSISSASDQHNIIKIEPVDKASWWKNDNTFDKLGKESNIDLSHSSSCSQQALNPTCDVTIDELASYFETLVHIPKKMSSMAEMMYI